MNDLEGQLKAAGISGVELAVLSRTDRGDVLYFTTSGGEGAINLWEKLRAMAGATGHWPVLLGDIEKLTGLRDVGRKNPESVAETLKHAQTIAVPEWFKKKQGELLAEFKKYNDGEAPADWMPQEGEWPRNVLPGTRFSSPFVNFSETPVQNLGIALVPTEVPSEVVAFLEFGGWNWCPDNAEHCALHRYWEREFGAVVIAVTTDVVEMKVERGPNTRESAMSLAWQQYVYCADIVEQGTETIANLAATLLGGTSWFFWWD
jgi:hypothetical protein